jgi:hypothetical protein
MTKNEIERLRCERAAIEEYESYLGKKVNVKTIQGYRDDHNSHYYGCDNVIVRVMLTPLTSILRWTDEDHLDPVWNVEIIKRGSLPEDLRSCWIDGSTQRPFLSSEPGDIMEDPVILQEKKIINLATDLYKDFDEQEIKLQPTIIKMLWEAVKDYNKMK